MSDEKIIHLLEDILKELKNLNRGFKFSEKYEQFKNDFINDKKTIITTREVEMRYDISRVTALKWMGKVSKEVDNIKFKNQRGMNGSRIFKT